MKIKRHRVDIRLTDIMMRKFLAICSVRGMTKTAVIEEFINSEYVKNKKYADHYYNNLEEKILEQ